MDKALEDGTWDSEDDSDIPKVKIILSNGSEYPELGESTAVDRGVRIIPVLYVIVIWITAKLRGNKDTETQMVK